MSETKHSPEPWRHNGHAWMWDATGAGHWMQVTGEQGEANARRIVACVNACKDLPTSALESGRLGEALDALRRVADKSDDPVARVDARSALQVLGVTP